MPTITDGSAWLKRVEKRREPEEWERCILLLSKDEYERKSLLKVVIDALAGADVQRLDAERLKLPVLLQHLNTLPFLGSTSLIILLNISQADKALLAELSRYVKRPNPQAILLMEGSSLSGTTALAKAVEKEGLLLKIPELRPWEAERSVEDWMQAYVARSQQKLEPAASKVLAKQLGTDKTLLASEIDKLLCYVGERKSITVDDVTAVCCCVPLDTVWQLGEAVLGRQVHQALKITRQQLFSGVQFLGLLWQLRAQLNTAYQVAAILALGGGPQGVSAQFPYMRGKILERNMRLAQAYGLKRFKRAIQLVNQSDSHAKNSQGAAELLAETLIIKLCQA